MEMLCDGEGQGWRVPSSEPTVERAVVRRCRSHVSIFGLAKIQGSSVRGSFTVLAGAE